MLIFHNTYEEMVRFASLGQLAEELQLAKAEFIKRTGELFESDHAFERRIASFLEWYVLDRPLSFAPHLTPAKMYIDSVAAKLTTPELTELRCLTKSILSIYEFRRFTEAEVLVIDLFSKEKQAIFERRNPVGLNMGDIFEARVVPYEGKLMFTDAFSCYPTVANKVILKAIKQFRKIHQHNMDNVARISLAHRIAFLANRAERYKHVDPKKIFAELLLKPQAA